MMRAWQVVACKGNCCAALLLNHFEYWHNTKLKQAKKARKKNNNLNAQDEEKVEIVSLLQFHKIPDLQFSLFYCFGKDGIAQAVRLLNKLNFISIHQSPYLKTDRTHYFQFLPANVNEWIEAHQDDVRRFVSERKFDDPRSETSTSISATSILEKRTPDAPFPKSGETVNTEITTDIPPPPPPPNNESINEFWEISLPTQVETNRDALVAAARKARRDPKEMQAAARAAILVAGARDPVALTITRLKDRHWTPFPEKVSQKKIVQKLTSSKNETKRCDKVKNQEYAKIKEITKRPAFKIGAGRASRLEHGE
jgi:hypothetical protein